MVNASIAFLNGNSFKRALTNRQFFWQAYVRVFHSFKIYIGFGLIGFKVYDSQLKVEVEGLDLRLGFRH
jgi:hypothetical protein